MGLMAADVANDLIENFETDYLFNLVRQFIDDARNSLNTISNAHRSADFDLAKGQAHSLKGSSSMLGFKDLALLAHTIEVSIIEMSIDQLATKILLVNENLDVIERTLP